MLAAGDRLQPVASATTVRLADGKTNVMNRPYAETREQLGRGRGFLISWRSDEADPAVRRYLQDRRMALRARTAN